MVHRIYEMDICWKRNYCESKFFFFFLLPTLLLAGSAANLNTIRILDFNRGIDLGSQFFQLLFVIGVLPLRTSRKLSGVFV